MQSDGNSFGGDAVLDSFNKAIRDEDNILVQVYKSKYVRIFITTVALKPNFLSSFLLRAVFLSICIFLNHS